MKKNIRNTTLSIAIAAGLAGAAWAPAGHACSTEDYLGSVCATAFSFGNWGQQFAPADGRLLQVSQYTALYSLLGNTFGGSASTTFGLPDLRGRVIVGVGTGPGMPPISWGQTGGTLTNQLSSANLPVHNHGVSAVTVNTSALSVNTTMTGLAATANLGGVAISGPATGLTLKASAQTGTSITPSTGSAIGAVAAPLSKIYVADSAPSVALSSGSISGTLNLAIANGTTAPVSISGTPSSTLTGSASLAGTTDNTGSGTSFSNMQPYLGLNYYVAIVGLYPARD